MVHRSLAVIHHLAFLIACFQGHPQQSAMPMHSVSAPGQTINPVLSLTVSQRCACFDVELPNGNIPTSPVFMTPE